MIHHFKQQNGNADLNYYRKIFQGMKDGANRRHEALQKEGIKFTMSPSYYSQMNFLRGYFSYIDENGGIEPNIVYIRQPHIIEEISDFIRIDNSSGNIKFKAINATIIIDEADCLYKKHRDFHFVTREGEVLSNVSRVYEDKEKYNRVVHSSAIQRKIIPYHEIDTKEKIISIIEKRNGAEWAVVWDIILSRIAIPHVPNMVDWYVFLSIDHYDNLEIEPLINLKFLVLKNNMLKDRKNAFGKNDLNPAEMFPSLDTLKEILESLLLNESNKNKYNQDLEMAYYDSNKNIRATNDNKIYQNKEIKNKWFGFIMTIIILFCYGGFFAYLEWSYWLMAGSLFIILLGMVTSRINKITPFLDIGSIIGALTTNTISYLIVKALLHFLDN